MRQCKARVMKAAIEKLAEYMPYIGSHQDLRSYSDYVIFFLMRATSHKAVPLYLSFKQGSKGYRLQIGDSEYNPLI